MEFLKRGINDTNVKAYHQFMVDSAVIFGADRSVAEVEMLDSLQFEIELAKVCCHMVSICGMEYRKKSHLSFHLDRHSGRRASKSICAVQSAHSSPTTRIISVY